MQPQQQGIYQQQGYPPQQQQGYPPQQQQGFPPQQQQGYPPQQQQGFPPQQGIYQGGAPMAPNGGFQQHAPPPKPQHADDFMFGLCSCFENCSACMEGFCCTYCQIGAQFNRTEHNNTGTYVPVCCGMIFLDCCCGFAGMAQCVGNMMVRGKIRSRYNIEQSCCNDCFVSMFCRWCASTQQYQELVFRGAWPGGVCTGTPPPQSTDPMGLETNMMQL